jgi:transketolase
VTTREEISALTQPRHPDDWTDLDSAAVDTIRVLAADAVQKVGNGHPGTAMSLAPLAYTLFQRTMRHDPSDTGWLGRDRFVLSAGHGSMLLYSLLYLTGYDLPLAELERFRQWGSKTPGHPEFGVTPGGEATTGPLGQGFANAVGMAIAERRLAYEFNRPGHEIVDHRTFALVSDGDLMEGISSEAGSLAGHLKLGKLLYVYDDNHVTLDGPTSWSFTEDVGKRYEAYGWQVLHVEDGNTDLDGLEAAIRKATSQAERPTLIRVRTTIGYGSPHKAGTNKAHGSPLGPEEVALTKKALGWEWTEPFTIPPDALTHFRTALTRGTEAQKDWERRFADYAKAFPDLAQEWSLERKGALPAGWDADLPAWKDGEAVATRDASHAAIEAIAKHVPWLIGGDADLSESTKTRIDDGGDFDGTTGDGRNVHYGVREHAMASMANGMAYHGGLRPLVATFFCFSDYMRPAIRLAAISKLPVLFVWTHDSVGLGEDGPTHQPVEHLMALRAVPNLHVIRPSDANETTGAWRCAIPRTHGPTVIVLSRQKMATWDRAKQGSAGNIRFGAYVLADAEGPLKAILIASGSEVELAMKARDVLQKESIGTRVVSMPCWELFDAQDAAYKESILPAKCAARVSIEAGATLGWAKWIGAKGVALGIDKFGASAPAEKIFEEYGFTVANVVAAAKRAMA